MERQQLLKVLKSILEEVLVVNDLEVTEQTSANDIEDWDSIIHIEIIVAIEEYFELKFPNAAIIRFKNLGDIIDGILQIQII